MENTHVSPEFRSQPHIEASAPRYRQVSIGRAAVEVTEQQGALHMRSLEPLDEYPPRLLDRLVHWAQVRPEQTFIAARARPTVSGAGSVTRRCSTVSGASPKAC